MVPFRCGFREVIVLEFSTFYASREGSYVLPPLAPQQSTQFHPYLLGIRRFDNVSVALLWSQVEQVLE
jgi:hypothetical protein